MRKRTLNLKKETLTELSSTELGAVAGGVQEITKPNQCISGIVSCVTYRCPTWDACFTTHGCA